VVEQRDTLKELAALARSGPYIVQAPLAIVVAMEKSPYAVSDASRAIQSMILTAWAEGVGSNWVGFQNLAQVKPLLEIPDEVDVIAILPFGYPVQKIGKRPQEPQAVGAGGAPRALRRTVCIKRSLLILAITRSAASSSYKPAHCLVRSFQFLAAIPPAADGARLGYPPDTFALQKA